MLTKKDLQAIDGKIITALGDFFEQVLAPYFEKHIIKRLDNHDKRFEEIEQKFDRRFDRVDRKLEKIHDKLDKHDLSLENHKIRIARLEKHPSFA